MLFARKHTLQDSDYTMRHRRKSKESDRISSTSLIFDGYAKQHKQDRSIGRNKLKDSYNTGSFKNLQADLGIRSRYYFEKSFKDRPDETLLRRDTSFSYQQESSYKDKGLLSRDKQNQHTTDQHKSPKHHRESNINRDRLRTQTDAYNDTYYPQSGRMRTNDARSPTRYFTTQQQKSQHLQQNSVLCGKLKRAERKIDDLEDQVAQLRYQLEQQTIHNGKCTQCVQARNDGKWAKPGRASRDLQTLGKVPESSYRDAGSLGKPQSAQSEVRRELQKLRMEVTRQVALNKKTNQEKSQYKKKYKEMEDQNSRLKVQSLRDRNSQQKAKGRNSQNFNITTILESSNESSRPATEVSVEMEQQRRPPLQTCGVFMDQVSSLLLKKRT